MQLDLIAIFELMTVVANMNLICNTNYVKHNFKASKNWAKHLKWDWILLSSLPKIYFF